MRRALGWPCRLAVVTIVWAATHLTALAVARTADSVRWEFLATGLRLPDFRLQPGVDLAVTLGVAAILVFLFSKPRSPLRMSVELMAAIGVCLLLVLYPQLVVSGRVPATIRGTYRSVVLIEALVVATCFVAVEIVGRLRPRVS